MGLERHCRRCAVLGASLLSSVAALAAAQQPDVVRGRIMGADSAGLQNASVRVIAGPDSIVRVTRTDARGAWSVTFPGAATTYVVSVTMLGYAPQRRTVTRQPGTEALAPVDFHLVPVAARLGTVRSTGQRPKPPRSENSEFNAPGSSFSFADLARGTSGDVTGDLTAALMTLPGITVISDPAGGIPSVSAFGQTSDQNSTVLNGLGFGGTPPRDGFGVAVISSTYDPSRGGFAGIQLSVRMQQGNNLVSRSIHTTFDSPEMQYTTPVASQFGNKYDQQVVSGVLSGPIVLDKAFYSLAYQVNHRTSALSSLYGADAASLLAMHVSPDSVSRLMSTVGSLGIPVTASAVPGQRSTTEGRFATRLDFSPASANAPALAPGIFILGAPGGNDNYNVQVGGSWRSNDGTAIGPTSLPAAGAETSHRDGWAQFNVAKYLPRGFLNEIAANVSASRDVTDPYLLLPSARVLVTSELPDGSLGISSLQVGGSGSSQLETTTWRSELRDQLSRYSWDRHHLVTLTVDGAVDHFGIDQAAGLGTYSYNSLADFAAGLPASYSRTLTGRADAGSGITGAVGLGDLYAPADNFRSQFGIRVEGNQLSAHPTFNPVIDSVFGLRTDHVPSTVAVMPMAGFTWRTFGDMTFPGSNFKFPRGSISGGIREYRGSITSRSIDNYARQTGLPDAIQQLYCVGAAAPQPQWAAFAHSLTSVPGECADGTLGTPLAQVAPPVALFAPEYSLSRSWRPTLNLNYGITPGTSVSVGGTYTLNLDQPGMYDVNFVDAPRFTVPSEGGRPVYASPSSIVPATGTMAWTDSRESDLFAHVAESRSDLRSQNVMLSAGLQLSPVSVGVRRSFWFMNLNYVHIDPREQIYGFQGSTAGDPTLKTWTAGSGAHNVVTVSFNQTWQRLFSYTITGRAQSGLPFTPSAIGDINGDGYSNDRAFIFNPAATADTSVGNAMSRLLAGAPPSVRHCLETQLGTIAGRNSCVGPWSFPLLNISLNPDSYRLGLGNRGSLSILLTNVLSGIDQLVHGPNDLHGWGQSAYPDPTLLTVRGFDPTAQRFIYTVNPLFGSTTVFRNTFRSPFVMSIDFKMEVGPDRETQYMDLALRPSAGARSGTVTLEQIKSKISRQPFNPLDRIVQQKDSLGLTTGQVDTLSKLARRYAVTRDSLVTGLARFLLARRGNYTGEEVRSRWHATAIETFTAARAIAREARPVFTAEQMDKLRHNLGLGNFIVQDYTPEEIEQLLRGPMSTLP